VSAPITNEEYFLLTSLVKTLAQDYSLIDDLTQEVAIYWMEYDEDKKQNLRDKNLVKAWFIRTILNQDRSKTSYFYKRWKTQPKLDSKDMEDIQDEFYEESEEAQNLELVKVWMDQLFESDRNIIKDYYEKGMTIMGISAKYDVDKNYVVGVLNRVKSSFYRRLVWRKVPRRMLENSIVENLAPMIGRKRLRSEERQLILDAHNHIFGTFYNTWFDREICSYLLLNLIQKLKI
jgi:DNA-directed RNA polymerase specialized sigma24 family protein